MNLRLSVYATAKVLIFQQITTLNLLASMVPEVFMQLQRY